MGLDKGEQAPGHGRDYEKQAGPAQIITGVLIVSI